MAKFAAQINSKKRGASRIQFKRVQKQKKNERSLQAQGHMKKKNPKNLQLPNLQKHKKKILNSLKSKKESSSLSNAIDKLQSTQKLHMSDFVNKEDYIQNLQESDGYAEYEPINNSNLNQGKKYFKDIKKVIESCDILVEVLDARDPMASRCKTIQQKIHGMPGEKKIILLLNKIDLIPVQNAQIWQTYLRRQYPTVLFKANLQNQNANLSSNVLFKKSLLDNSDVAQQMIKSSKAVGPDHLLQLIKQLSKVQGTNRAVTVGLIGYPNVGKSSVINSLKRAKACEVSAIAGSTKNLQQVKLDKQVKLLDCPGVIFQKQNKKNLILRNTLKLDDQLEQIVEQIIKKVHHIQLLEFYKLQSFTSAQDFLAQIAKHSGRLTKGGIPDFKQAAKLVVQDWNRGRLRYFSFPPGYTPPNTSQIMDLQINA